MKPTLVFSVAHLFFGLVAAVCIGIHSLPLLLGICFAGLSWIAYGLGLKALAQEEAEKHPKQKIPD